MAEQEKPVTLTIDPATKSLKRTSAKSSKVRDRITVHEKTIQKIAKRAAAGKKTATKSPRKRSQPKKKSEPPVVTIYKVRPDWCNEDAWREAMALAGGNYRRLLVENATTILVKNQ